VLPHFHNFLQGKCLLEGAKCCDNQRISAEEVQECIQRSQQPLSKVQSVIKNGKTKIRFLSILAFFVGVVVTEVQKHH